MYTVYQIQSHRSGAPDAPVYTLREGKLFRTVTHPRGWSELPEYELRADGLIYRLAHHPEGTGLEPDFRIGKDALLYRTDFHPEGGSSVPVYELRPISG